MVRVWAIEVDLQNTEVPPYDITYMIAGYDRTEVELEWQETLLFDGETLYGDVVEVYALNATLVQCEFPDLITFNQWLEYFAVDWIG